MVLFKILIGFVVPKNRSVDHASKDHKALMWNISKKIKTNLSNLIIDTQGHVLSTLVNERSK